MTSVQKNNNMSMTYKLIYLVQINIVGIGKGLLLKVILMQVIFDKFTKYY